ncbi:MAG: hypothetical protein COW08_09890 [Ignavibacteriales bacterium CG12_big_fil_rev_8_21_14_0_65_30_8]|nr:MAG: hypothetical protein COW08_09890 [Ignavibacteriales bacterium CG12_big_fil_rev_8_21_14_0_65_30_8]
MPSGFKSLKEIFEKEPKLKGIRSTVKESMVISEFHSIFPEFKKAVVPEKIEKKRLFLKVENSVWRNELKFKEIEIIKKINTYFKTEIIKWIKFTP